MPEPTTPKALYAEFTAVAGRADEVESLLATLTIAVRGEPGNLVFDSYRKTEESDSFFVYEVYADEEAFQNHLSQEHGAIFNSALKDLVIGSGSALTWLTPVRDRESAGDIPS